MSYTPTNWKPGDVVTSTKLNKLEQGVATAGGASILVVNVTVDNDVYTCDKTAAEMYEAFPLVILRLDGGNYVANGTLKEVGIEAGAYGFGAYLESMDMSFEAASGTDYPTYEAST